MYTLQTFTFFFVPLKGYSSPIALCAFHLLLNWMYVQYICKLVQNKIYITSSVPSDFVKTCGFTFWTCVELEDKRLVVAVRSILDIPFHCSSSLYKPNVNACGSYEFLFLHTCSNWLDVSPRPLLTDLTLALKI